MTLWALFQLAVAVGSALAALAAGQEVRLPAVYVTWNDGRRFTVEPVITRIS